MKISDFEVVAHGIDTEDYFQGCGVSYTPYSDVVTGIGDNPSEAVDDCLEQIAMNGVDVEDMEGRICKECEIETLPTRPRVSSQQAIADCHYYVSIRYNTQEV